MFPESCFFFFFFSVEQVCLDGNALNLVKPLGWVATGLFLAACFLFYFSPSLGDDNDEMVDVNVLADAEMLNALAGEGNKPKPSDGNKALANDGNKNKALVNDGNMALANDGNKNKALVNDGNMALDNDGSDSGSEGTNKRRPSGTTRGWVAQDIV
jgi:hypothetical protein